MVVKKEQLLHYIHRTTRFVELDLLRGMAILVMVFLHVLWDLDYFGFMPLDRDIYQFQVIIPTLFFILMGICLVITTNKKHGFSNKELRTHLLSRGLWIFGLGMIITIATLLFMPDRPIFFGVLHCIGFSIILSIPLLRLKKYNIAIGFAIIIVGFVMGFYPVQDANLISLIIGIHPANIGHLTIDYFPLFPWFGASLIGVGLGNLLYKDGKRQFRFPDISRYKPIALFSWLGKHSLTIYLIHQPIIAGILGYIIPKFL